MKLVRPKKKLLKRVVLSDCYEVDTSLFSEEAIDALKDSLTFDNPAYEAALKYSRYNRVAIDPYIRYYDYRAGTLYVPAGTDLSPLGKVSVVDERTEVPVKPPVFKLTLREDQKEAAEAYLTMNQVERHGMVQLPTGKGKTILALYLSAQLRQRTLVIVHKDDLVLGWNKDIQLCFGSQCKPGLIKAKSRKIGEFITVATVQTLSRMSEEELSKYLTAFGFVVCDEMHKTPSTMYSVVNRFTAYYRLGLSATPERKDGLTHVFYLYFGGFCYRYQPKVNEEDILPVHVLRREASFIRMDPLCERVNNRWVLKDPRIDPTEYVLQRGEAFLSSIPYERRPRLVYGDYSDIVTRRVREFACSDIISEYLKGHSCIVFLSQKQQVDDFFDYLTRTRHIPQDHVLKYYGDNTAKQNDKVLEIAEKNRQRITLATYSKATEGTNVKQWEVAFLVSSINDGKNTEQAVGRIRRVKDGHKLDCALVYDYRFPNVYSMGNHAITRDHRYRKLGFTFDNENPDKVVVSQKMFSRGYNSR